MTGTTISQFDLYDVVVDMIPGALAIFLFCILVSRGLARSIYNIANIPVGVISIIVVSYILGRTIHTISGTVSNLVEKYSYEWTLSLIRRSHDPSLDRCSSFLNALLLQCRKSIPVEQGDVTIDGLFTSARKPYADELSKTEYLKQKSNGNPLVLLANRVYYRFMKSEEYSPGVDSSIIRRTGYSLLYQSQGYLYRRYNILTTFYRNISFLFWTTTIVTTYQILTPLTDNATSPPLWTTIPHGDLVPFLSIGFGILFAREVFAYSGKRNLHFLIDYKKALEERQT